jgi:putative ABC transport system ATP-binding protein
MIFGRKVQAASAPFGRAPSPVIRLLGAGRTHPGPPPVSALRGVDLTVKQGDYLAITGPSGAGKSTMLNVLGLLDHLTEGSYELDGLDVSKLGEASRSAIRGSRIGFVFQSFHLLPHRTALENVVLAQVYNHQPHGRRKDAALAVLTRVGLAHRVHAMPTSLSGGERQRVAIARAIVNMPKLLLCDEPTGNLDSGATRSLLDLFDELNAAGLTIVVITHESEVAARTRRRVEILDGRLTLDQVTGRHDC